MALDPEQKKYETKRIKAIVGTLYEGGHEKMWTASELGHVLTQSLGTDGSEAPTGDHVAAAGWIMDGLIASKAMTQNEDGTCQVTKEAIFQYNNKSNFFSVKTPIGMVKVRQGAVVTIV